MWNINNVSSMSGPFAPTLSLMVWDSFETMSQMIQHPCAFLAHSCSKIFYLFSFSSDFIFGNFVALTQELPPLLEAYFIWPILLHLHISTGDP